MSSRRTSYGIRPSEVTMSFDPRRWEEIQTSFDEIVELDATRALEAGFLSQSDTAIDPLWLAGRTISHFEVHAPLGGRPFDTDASGDQRACAHRLAFPLLPRAA